MTDLKKARENGKLEDFIKEHEKDKPGDKDKLDKTIDRFVQGKSKPVPGTSKPGSP